MSAIKCFLVERVPGDQSPARWRRVDTGEVLGPNRDLPAGAMWEAPWMGDAFRVNGSGPVIVVRMPNGRDWMPGSQAGNCNRPGEDHDCWCVHGTAPDLTVDKAPEPGRTTCTAGAGSIGSGEGTTRWHGFLRGGSLVEA
jgi:hypothetical protein